MRKGAEEDKCLNCGLDLNRAAHSCKPKATKRQLLDLLEDLTQVFESRHHPTQKHNATTCGVCIVLAQANKVMHDNDGVEGFRTLPPGFGLKMSKDTSKHIASSVSDLSLCGLSGKSCVPRDLARVQATCLDCLRDYLQNRCGICEGKGGWEEYGKYYNCPACDEEAAEELIQARNEEKGD